MPHVLELAKPLASRMPDYEFPGASSVLRVARTVTNATITEACIKPGLAFREAL